ncbi:MAG: hypothetical protein PHN66_02740 [Candidatus Shapirobacteria bacterium]|nr:hypothetical protein [Candidatus Shapirobacteria bacterium]
MSKENQDCFFHQKEFFVERKLNEKGELVLVSQRRPVDFGQFTDVINLDKYPEFNKPKELIESDDEIIGKTKDGKPVFRNTDNSDMYKRPENIEMKMEPFKIETLPNVKKTKRKPRRKKLTFEQSVPLYY